MKLAYGDGEVVGVEVRPHPVGEVELGIGALPQQEIGQALLAAGADEQIDVAALSSPAHRLTSWLNRSRVISVRLSKAAAGAQDRVARRVVERDAQVQALAMRGVRFRSRDLVARPSGNRSRRPMTVSRIPLSFSRAISVRR